MEKTRVAFKKVSSGKFEGDVIAFFVDDTRYDYTRKKTLVSCYEHFGQHGEADLTYMLEDCETATLAEYVHLKDEMENLCGYDMEIVDDFETEIEVFFTTYAPETDMTFIMKEVGKGADVLTTECVGWYYGKPDDKTTELYTGKLIAKYEP